MSTSARQRKKKRAYLLVKIWRVKQDGKQSRPRGEDCNDDAKHKEHFPEAIMHAIDQPALLPHRLLSVLVRLRVRANVDDNANDEIGISKKTASHGKVAVFSLYKLAVTN